MLFFAYSEVGEHFTFASIQLELDSEKERRLDGLCVCVRAHLCLLHCVCLEYTHILYVCEKSFILYYDRILCV